jgi:hypothetical protein
MLHLHNPITTGSKFLASCLLSMPKLYLTNKLCNYIYILTNKLCNFIYIYIYIHYSSQAVEISRKNGEHRRDKKGVATRCVNSNDYKKIAIVKLNSLLETGFYLFIS